MTRQARQAVIVLTVPVALILGAIGLATLLENLPAAPPSTTVRSVTIEDYPQYAEMRAARDRCTSEQSRSLVDLGVRSGFELARQAGIVCDRKGIFEPR